MTPSIKDVAAAAGVSIGTVSNVLNHPERVKPPTVKKVQSAISALGFVRNDAARQLRAGASNTIALAVLEASNPFFAEMARGVENVAAERGYSVIVGNIGSSMSREGDYLDLFEQQRVKGVLISPHGNVEERLEALRGMGIPSVLVDRISAGQKFSSVSVDDVAGGKIAVQHLLDVGREKIGFVGGSLSVPQVRDRLAGAEQAVAQSSRASLEVFETDHTTVLEGRRIGKIISGFPAKKRPHALFAANDLVALGLLQAITSSSTLRVPGDISIIGYDDIDFSSSAIVPLTSIRQPSYLLGQTALEILLEEAIDPRIKPRQVVFQPELVRRDST